MIQEALELERRQKEEEERQIREEEENRRKYVISKSLKSSGTFLLHLTIVSQYISCFFSRRKIEMETKRKMEELERKRQEDEDLRAAVALQVLHSY